MLVQQTRSHQSKQAHTREVHYNLRNEDVVLSRPRPYKCDRTRKRPIGHDARAILQTATLLYVTPIDSSSILNETLIKMLKPNHS
jgi:hypothetical protein